MFYLTAIELTGGTGHEHISRVKWLNATNGMAGISTTVAMITWLREGNRAQVAGEQGPAVVEVINAARPYLRTRADGQLSDNLLALPRL